MERLICPEDTHLAEQRYKWSAIEIKASDKRIVVRPRCGALMGDPFAVHSFTETFSEPLGDFTSGNAVAQGAPASELVTTLPFRSLELFGCRRECDLSTTNFADDTQRIVLAAAGEGADDLARRIQSSSTLLSEVLEPTGFAQNTTKLVTIPVLSGVGSRKAMRSLRASGGSEFPGTVTDNARSLGAWINAFGTFAHEKFKRLDALRQARLDAGPMLRQPRLPYQLKRIF